MRVALDIAAREVRDNMATWKLPLAIVLTTLLLLAGVLSVSSSYREDVRAHNLVQDDFEANGLENSPEALAHRFLGLPNAMTLLVGGPGESVRAAVASAPVVTNESARGGQDPLRLRFLPTDLGSVGVGVLSLLAILVAYDGVCGEKERGTLKLLLLNPVSRSEVLFGKYLGAMTTILIPLGVALFLALVPMFASGIRFSSDEWRRLGLILVCLVVFLSAIVLLALAVSAMTTRSSVSILALTLAWLVLVAGAGSLAAFAASAEEGGRSADDVLKELRLIREDYVEQRDALLRQIHEQETRTGKNASGLRADFAALPTLQSRDEEALLASYLRGREGVASRAESYAVVSPAEAFRSATQRVARTDFEAAQGRLDEFSVYLREVASLRAENVSEPPAFRSAPHAAASDFERSSPFVFALVAQNVLALGAAVVAFSRYDVR